MAASSTRAQRQQTKQGGPSWLTEELRIWIDRAVKIAGTRVPVHVISHDDLRQIAEIETWRALQSYDPHNRGGVPFTGYAWPRVWGAMMMACRRRAYKEAQHDQIQPGDSTADFRDADMRIDRARVARILLEALAEMPSDQRKLIAEVVMPGIPLAHWCARHGVSFSKAKRIKDAALKALRHELRRHQIHAFPF